MKLTTRSSSSPLLFVSLAAVVAAFTAACGSSSTGSPPTVSNFVLSPTTLTVGKDAMITGTVTIADPDGNVTGATGQITFPDASVHPLVEASISASGQTDFTAQYSIPDLPVPLAGNYVVSVQARDSDGNQSNVVTFTLVASP